MPFILHSRAFLPLFLISNIIFDTPLQATPRPEDSPEVVECEKRLAIALRFQNLISEPVPGLFESILDNANLHYQDLNFSTKTIKPDKEHEGWDVVLVTNVLNSKGRRLGYVKRAFSSNLTEMRFSDIKFEKGIPSFMNIPESIPLVPGRGIPTQAFVTLMQMKIAGVQYGGLKYAETGPTSNWVTSLELIHNPTILKWMKRHPHSVLPNFLVSLALPQTTTGRYISTVLTQSGHQIDKIVVTETRMAMAFDFPDDDDVENTPYVKTLTKGLTSLDEVPYSFRLFFTLSPREKKN